MGAMFSPSEHVKTLVTCMEVHDSYPGQVLANLAKVCMVRLSCPWKCRSSDYEI